jgi:hypothetical protein
MESHMRKISFPIGARVDAFILFLEKQDVPLERLKNNFGISVDGEFVVVW